MAEAWLVAFATDIGGLISYSVVYTDTIVKYASLQRYVNQKWALAWEERLNWTYMYC